MTKKTNGYKLDLANQTLTMTAAFEAAANDPNSDEYALVRQLLNDFPKLKLVRKTHKTPTRYKNSDGSITSHNKFKGLTYEKMEKYIIAISPKNDTDYLETFYNVRDFAEAFCTSPYSLVSRWFLAQFPMYFSFSFYYVEFPPKIIDFSAFIEKVKEHPAAILEEPTEEEIGA